MDNIFTQEEIRFLQRLNKESGFDYAKYNCNGLDVRDDEVIINIVDNDFKGDDLNDADILADLLKKTYDKIQYGFELLIENEGNDIKLVKI